MWFIAAPSKLMHIRPLPEEISISYSCPSAMLHIRKVYSVFFLKPPPFKCARYIILISVMPFKIRIVNICGCISFKSAPIAQKEMHFVLQDIVFLSQGRLIYIPQISNFTRKHLTARE